MTVTSSNNKRKAELIPLQLLKGWALPQEKCGVVKHNLSGVRHFFLIVCLIVGFTACKTTDTPMPTDNPVIIMDDDDEGEIASQAIIDLSNWKVTLPVGNPSEVEPPEILDYGTNPNLKKWMYDDASDSSLVFYTEPGSTTPNSSYSRTELREQMKPGSNTVNWTFEDTGRMKGTLKVDEVSGEDGNLDRVIVMQIHGRLTNAQRDLIGEDDNNAPPVLKIYWDNGKINVRRKILKDVEVNDKDILKTTAWEDESHWFNKDVGNGKFTIEIVAKENIMQVILNDGEEAFKFEDVNVEKWAVFENYFKAGNYLIAKEKGAFALVKYYDLAVQH